MSVTVEFEGKRWEAQYRVGRGFVQVRSIYGDRTSRISDMPPEYLAELMYLEILQSAKREGWLS